MNNAGNGNNWPMVPIFGRRKRPRQAFYASPSQDTYQTQNLVQEQTNNKSYRNKSSSIGYSTQSNTVNLEDDILLDDFDYDDTSHNSIGKTKKDANQFNSDNWKTPGTLNHRNQNTSFKAPSNLNKLTQNISLQKHPRNNFQAEREFKSTKENKENIGGHFNQEQRRENTTIQNQMKRDDKSKLLRSRSTVPRILTLTTGDINEIIGHKDMLFALYEVYGILDSQVITVHGQSSKRFIIRDSSGTIQCVFWEIDRPLPHIRRGTLVRCVGRLVNETFQCLSIRTSNQAEMNYAKILQTQSKEVIENCLLTCREL